MHARLTDEELDNVVGEIHHDFPVWEIDKCMADCCLVVIENADFNASCGYISKGILLPSWQLLKSVATLLKVLIAQELLIQCNFLLPRSHTFNHTHICNIAHARKITCNYVATPHPLST